GALSGFVAGLVYKLIESKNKYLAVMAAAIVCPLVNTGTFILGCFIFFRDALVSGAADKGISIAEFIIVFYVGLNFVFELISNIVLSPTIVKLLNIRKKKQ
ncbi:MAG: ECF transporter S component, partial [Christensenellaceae bacterium]|nr:ECF transporter S component [Christensenellaceae bacterium]